MLEPEYLDLATFGLPLVRPSDTHFSALARGILDHPQPFPDRPIDDLRGAAVLLNQSGKAVIGMSHSWRYTMANGTSRLHKHTNLGSSSIQMDILTGRSPVPQDMGTCILAGSKRLITERGMFGSNLDVLPAAGARQGGGYLAGGISSETGSAEPILATRLSLDLAVFSDGLCAGPDPSGIFDALTASLAAQRSLAESAVKALRDGRPDGEIFELFLPMARAARNGSAERHPFQQMFGRLLIDRLVQLDRPELLTFLDRFAQAPTLKLRRA